MTAPLIVHAGFPRTATTSIQHSLTNSCGNGLYLGKCVGTDRRWRFPEMDALDKSLRGLASGSLDTQSINALLRDAAARGGDKPQFLFYSNETLSKPWPAGGESWIDAQIKMLCESWPNVKAIFTVRNQVELIYSIYRKYLKQAVTNFDNPSGFRSWYRKTGPSDYVDIEAYFSFDRMISRYREVLGPENVAILPFEYFVKNPAMISEAIKELIPAAQVEIDLDSKMNASEPLDQVRLRITRKRTPLIVEKKLDRIPRKTSQTIYNNLAKVFSPRVRYSMNSRTRSELLSTYRKSNQRLQELLGADLPQSYFE